MLINFPKKTKSEEVWSDTFEKDIIDIYNNWYDKYIAIIRYISNISTTMFIASSTFLMSDFINSNLSKLEDINNFSLFFKGLGLIFASVVFSFVCLLTTYNWYRTILEKIKEASSINYNDLINDNIYSDKKMSESSNTKTWGIISWLTGYLSGITLLIGLGCYGFGAYKLLELIINKV